MRRLRAALGLVALGLIAASCAATGTPAHRLQVWERQTGFSSGRSLLRTDLAEIATGLERGPLVAVRTACDGLGVDVANDYANLPAPDHRLTSDLNAAYIDLEDAAQACSETHALSSPEVARYRRLVRRGLGALERARQRIALVESA